MANHWDEKLGAKFVWFCHKLTIFTNHGMVHNSLRCMATKKESRVYVTWHPLLHRPLETHYGLSRLDSPITKHSPIFSSFLNQIEWICVIWCANWRATNFLSTIKIKEQRIKHEKMMNDSLLQKSWKNNSRPFLILVPYFPHFSLIWVI